MIKKDYYGSISVALSCTLFLECALKKYKKDSSIIDDDTMRLIKEWNIILLSLLKDTKYKHCLGLLGNKLINSMSRNNGFIPRCIVGAHDVSVQSLHYVLRFQESISFLNNKIQKSMNTSFCDLGCGLSPLSAVFQTKYNLSDVYCIDVIPEIADIYTDAAYKLGGKMPTFISWDDAKRKTYDSKLNMLVSVGCLPHMSIEEQKQYLRDINKFFDNFFVEIKYKNKDGILDTEGVFSLEELRKLRLNVENVDDIETAAIRNCMRYMLGFIRLRADRKDFLVDHSRSLFLSR